MTENSDMLLTEAEKETLASALGYGSTSAEGKQTIHTFLNNIATAPDTTKVGYLAVEELGNPLHTMRTYKNMSLVAEKIMDNKELADYFIKKSEIITASSLSKEGFLIKQATTTTRNIGDVTKRRRQNKGWFRKKESDDGEEVQ